MRRRETTSGRETGGRPSLPALAIAALAVLALALGLTACGGAGPANPSPTVSPSPTPPAAATVTVAAATPPPSPSLAGSAPSPRASETGATPTAAATPPSLDGYPPVVGLAVDRLAGDLGVPREAISVLVVEPRDWPSTALGCPEPGRAYSEVITPGYRIVLGAQGRQYTFHSEGAKRVVRCEAAATAPSPGATPMADYPPVVQLAVDDLADELRTRPEEINVVSVEETEWPDSSLGCPQPGRAYLQVITPGYRIILAAGGRQHTYHTDQNTMVVRCQQ